jgi:hypothetical protein
MNLATRAMSTIRKINAFFEAYENRFNASLTTGKVDVKGTSESFAKCFIEASPLGVNCGKNNFILRFMIPRGYAFYKKIGTKSMKILSKEITPIDTFHSMVKVRWSSAYIRQSDGSPITIDFDVTYFLQHLKDEMKIFAYVTGDEQKTLRDMELIKE